MSSVTPQLISMGMYAKNKVDSIGENPQNPDGTIKGGEDDEAVKKVHPGIVDGIAVAGVASAVTTMALTTGHIVDAASYATMGMAPYAAYQKRNLNKLGGMRGQQNDLREHVNHLSAENDKLTASIDGLAASVSELEGVEAELNDIAMNAETSVNRLVDIVKENGEVQAKIKQNLERQVIHRVIEVVTRVDRNNDYHLNQSEVNSLMRRLNTVPGIVFRAEKFRAYLEEHHGGNMEMNISDMMGILRNLQDDSVPDEENIFSLKPDDLAK